MSRVYFRLQISGQPVENNSPSLLFAISGKLKSLKVIFFTNCVIFKSFMLLSVFWELQALGCKNKKRNLRASAFRNLKRTII